MRLKEAKMAEHKGTRTEQDLANIIAPFDLSWATLARVLPPLVVAVVQTVVC